MLVHVEWEDPPAVVGKHDQDEEDAEASSGHEEEIDRDQVTDMIGKKSSPILGWPGASLGHEPGDRALGDVRCELTMDARGTPQGIRAGHCPHKCGDLGTDARTTSGRLTRQLVPVLAEATALPSGDGVRRHDDQSLPPAGPHFRQPDPEET